MGDARVKIGIVDIRQQISRMAERASSIQHPV